MPPLGGSSPYTNWNPRAVPGTPPKGYNCMQLLSATFLEVLYTFLYTINYTTYIYYTPSCSPPG